MEEVCVAKGVTRNYWAGHVTYSGVLHDEKTDNKIDFKDAVWRHLRTLPDGDVVEIIVRRTGERCPLGDDNRRSDMEEVCVAKGFKRDWWSGSVTYSGVLHDEKTDNKIDFKDAVWRHLRTLPDGDVVEIIVRRTGERCPLGDDKWVLLRPHKYGPKSFLVKMTKVQEAKEEVAAALRQEKLALDALDAAKARLEDTIRSTRRAIDVARALRELFLSEWRARGWETEEENDEPV